MDTANINLRNCNHSLQAKYFAFQSTGTHAQSLNTQSRKFGRVNQTPDPRFVPCFTPFASVLFDTRFAAASKQQVLSTVDQQFLQF
jgi:hypothetical protein